MTIGMVCGLEPSAAGQHAEGGRMRKDGVR